jgi:hypothetical protein
LFVRAQGQSAIAPPAPSPEFALAGSTAIRLPVEWHNRETVRCLESRVARNPLDLLSHMRRIWLLRDMGQAAAAASAAIDLFIAAQDKGLELRQRVVRTLAAELRECNCYETLHKALEAGLSRHDPRADRAESLLCRPVLGSFDVIRRLPESGTTAAIDDRFDWSLESDESGAKA